VSKPLADGCVLAGAGLIVAAGWLVHPAAGLFLAGVFLSIVGILTVRA